ncbi:ABC transporter substrate-binding protein [Marinobacterium ramblicola]|uniref:ABC transporter substrate-binding protein n=1 Tax=Marinobacterium ramblicola TaxID=2849041 RepID=UPI001FEAF64E|nr:ABC transporter substrate-binding protein [Marinobacterium ramblicola]
MLKPLLSAGVVAVLALAGTAHAEPTPQNTVKIQAAFEFSSLDPSSSGYVYTRMQILETLLNVDDRGALLPGLAEAWSVEDGGKAWQLTLREGVLFHDGTPLNAQIAAAELNRAAAKPSALQGVPISAIVATDARTLRIELSEPYRPLGAVLAHYSTALLAPSAYDANQQVTALIGTGPFAVHEITVPHKLVVERFDAYWGRTAGIEYASYLTGHRAEARVLQARSGQADIVFGLDPASVPMLKRLPNLDIVRSDLPRSLALKLNAGHPYLADARAREALSLAINRTGIATAILHAPEAASDQLLPSYMSDWHLPNRKAQFSPDRATELLAELGWRKNSERWLERDGKTFELNLITYADRPELTSVATAIQDQWKQLGVKLNVSITNSSAIPAGHSDGSLEVALIARNYGVIADPLGVLIKDFGSERGGDWGSMDWANAQVRSDLTRLVAENDPGLYRRQAQRIAEAIYTERPLIPIAYYVQQTSVNSRLTGFRFDPYERSYFLNELSWR